MCNSKELTDGMFTKESLEFKSSIFKNNVVESNHGKNIGAEISKKVEGSNGIKGKYESNGMSYNNEKTGFNSNANFLSSK